jgi:anaerobic selenocysteine-containing dehydrogenase
MFCPLDCWDACGIEISNNKFTGSFLSSYLCWKLNNYDSFKREINAKFNSKNIMLSNALNKLFTILKETEPKRVLFIKGSGNMGIMQNVTKVFFEKYGATFAVGSTCDGIGEEGIIKGRGKSLILPLWIIKNSKRVLIWGRNPAVTNIHLLKLIRNKKVFVIDVVKTKTAKMFDYFLIKPNSDYFLAILLAQEVMKKGLIKRRDGNNFSKYKRLVFSFSKEELMQKTGIDNEKLNFLVNFIKDGAVVLTGLGVAKCKECAKSVRAIDSLFFMLDFFGKNDRGVAFLGSSGYGLNNPFKFVHKNTSSLFDINLDNFDTVFIQGANPLISFLNRKEWNKLKDKKTIVFGKYYDETAKIATLFIPTKEFYSKKDIRGSYFHEYVLVNKNSKKDYGISEYELTDYLMKKFSFSGLREEDIYINEILNSNLEKITDTLYKKKIFDNPPYLEGFFTNDKRFNFLEEKFNYKEKSFEVVTAKSEKALNSQFQREEYIYINSIYKGIILDYQEGKINYSRLPCMLKWIVDNNLQNKLNYSNDIAKNIIFAKGGAIINAFLKASGMNGYYELS